MSFILCVLILLIFCPFTAILCCYIFHPNNTQFKRKNEENEKILLWKLYYNAASHGINTFVYTFLHASVHCKEPWVCFEVPGFYYVIILFTCIGIVHYCKEVGKYVMQTHIYLSQWKFYCLDKEYNYSNGQTCSSGKIS